MDTFTEHTDALKEMYLQYLYSNAATAGVAPDIHGINYAISTQSSEPHLGTLRISFSIDIVGRNILTRERKILKDLSLLPIVLPKDDEDLSYVDQVMYALHILMDQVEVDWIQRYIKKIDI